MAEWSEWPSFPRRRGGAPYISPHLAASRRISPHLAHISPTSPQALRGLPGGERVQRPPDIPFSKDGGKGLAARAERVQRSPSA